MKIEIYTDLLEQILKKMKALQTPKGLPISNHVLVQTISNTEVEFILPALDDVYYMQISAPAKIIEEGATTIELKTFYDYIKTINANYVKVERNEKNQGATIRWGRHRSNIAGLPVEEVPEAPETQKILARLAAEANVFKSAIQAVESSCATDNSRPILTGVNFSFDDECVRIAGANGYMIAVTPLQVTSIAYTEDWSTVTIPIRGLKKIVKQLDEESDVALEFVQTQYGREVILKNGNDTYFLGNIEGTFPNFQLIAQGCEKHPKEFVLDRKEMINALKQCMLFAQDNFDSIRLQYESDNKVAIIGRSNQRGECVTLVDLKTGSVNTPDPGKHFSFNGDFMSDLLKSFTGNQIKIHCKEPEHPIRITDPADTPENYRIIMPMRN